MMQETGLGNVASWIRTQIALLSTMAQYKHVYYLFEHYLL